MLLTQTDHEKSCRIHYFSLNPADEKMLLSCNVATIIVSYARIQPPQTAVLEALPFRLGEVALPAESRLAFQRDGNTRWLMSLNESRLTCLYTSAANMTCSTTGFPYSCNASAEKPACEPYRHERYGGHFLGHYLSATAMIVEGVGDLTVAARARSIVSTLGKVQAAFANAGDPGLIFPFDSRAFQNLYDKAPEGPGGDGGGNCMPICVPFYVLHKESAPPLPEASRTLLCSFL